MIYKYINIYICMYIYIYIYNLTQSKVEQIKTSRHSSILWHTHTQTHRETQTHTETHTGTQTHTHVQTQWHRQTKRDTRTHRQTDRQTDRHTHSLGLDVGLLPHRVGDLLTVVVFLLGFGQLLHRLLQLRLDPTQLVHDLWRGGGGGGGERRRNTGR